MFAPGKLNTVRKRKMTNTIFEVASVLAEKCECLTVRFMKEGGNTFLVVEPVMPAGNKTVELCEPFLIQYEKDEAESSIAGVFRDWVTARGEVFDGAKDQVERMKKNAGKLKEQKSASSTGKPSSEPEKEEVSSAGADSVAPLFGDEDD